jgi:tripartite-type tricarboxylate transporter receptor subunit TctC
VFVASFFVAAPLFVCSASAQDGATRLTLIVGAPPGGGYDVYGRIVGRHLVKHLPLGGTASQLFGR